MSKEALLADLARAIAGAASAEVAAAQAIDCIEAHGVPVTRLLTGAARVVAGDVRAAAATAVDDFIQRELYGR